jgi:integrase
MPRKDYAITTPEEVSRLSAEHERRNLPSKERIKLDLTDARIEARQEFFPAGVKLRILQDHGGTRSVRGLQMHIGPRSATWIFYRDVIDHGTRSVTSRKLGDFPSMNTDAARKAAEVLAGAYAGGRGEPSRTKSMKFGQAFASYVEYLKLKAEDEGKAARWAKEVQRLGNKIMLPKWADWSLLDMSKRRDPDVSQWYKAVAKDHGLTSAGHCLRIIRAVYMRAAKSDDSLPGDPTKVPTAAIIVRKEKWQKVGEQDKPGLAPAAFPAWLEAWRALPDMRKAYHLVGLLTGARPGELARTPWSNLDLKKRTLTIQAAKTGNNIPIPLSAPIARALKLARDSKAIRNQKKDAGLIFKGCDQAARDNLPATGHAYRRTYKTIAFMVGINNETSAFLLGHVPPGISAGYALRRILSEADAMRRHQSTISARILKLLGIDPTLTP